MKEIEEFSSNIICPYCGEPFSPVMLMKYDFSYWMDTPEEGAIGCQYVDGVENEISIYCEKCKRLVYRKTVYGLEYYEQKSSQGLDYLDWIQEDYNRKVKS